MQNVAVTKVINAIYNNNSMRIYNKNGILINNYYYIHTVIQIIIKVFAKLLQLCVYVCRIVMHGKTWPPYVH